MSRGGRDQQGHRGAVLSTREDVRTIDCVSKEEIVASELLIDLLYLHKRLCSTCPTNEKTVEEVLALTKEILSFAQKRFKQVVDFGSKGYGQWGAEPPQYLEHLFRPCGIFQTNTIPELNHRQYPIASGDAFNPITRQ